MAGMNSSGAQYATLGMGTLNVLMTLISLFLVELSGRKTLLLIGFSSMFIDTVLLTISLMFVVSKLRIKSILLLVKKINKNKFDI